MAASTAEHQSCSHFGFSEGSPWKETMIDLLLLPAMQAREGRQLRGLLPLPHAARAQALAWACVEGTGAEGQRAEGYGARLQALRR